MAVNNEYKKGIEIIDKLYPNLYNLDEIKHHTKENVSNKYEILENYFTSLEKVHNKVNSNPKYQEARIKRLKEIYYKWCIIKKENIPDSYFEKQKQMLLERGYGHIYLSHDDMDFESDRIIENQKRSLDEWIDYFMSDDSKFYPFWAKYWAFIGMTKIGNYNEKSYTKRTDSTVAPFVELNKEALALTIDSFINYLGKKEIPDEKLQKLLETNSFQKLYLYLLHTISKSKKNIGQRKEGIWIKYEKDSDHMPLVNSLKGRNTGWCTAGESVAEEQLALGDFYVYYTLDNNDEYKIPRVAIRMEKNRIAEIRGIMAKQEIEPEMMDIVKEKLKEFPNQERYFKITNNMKKMTEIYKKHKNKEELSKEELRFLYEIDGYIAGFKKGTFVQNMRDPRVDEIIKERVNIRKDLAIALDCDESQIAFDKSELTKDTKCYRGDLDLSEITSVEEIILPEYILGNLNLNGLTSVKGLKLPKHIYKNLYLNGITSTEGLELPDIIEGNLCLDGLTSLENIKFPKEIVGALYLVNVEKAKNVIFPEFIESGIFIGKLKEAEDVIFPKYQSSLRLEKLTRAKNVVFPENIDYEVNLNSLIDANNVILSKRIEKNLELRSLKRTEGIVFPEYIGGSIDLRSLTNAKELVLPKNIKGNLDLRSLTSIDESVFPKYIEGYLNLNSITNINNLNELLSKCKINGLLSLNGITSANGLVLPNEIKTLELNGLTNAKDLVLPNEIEVLELNGLTNAKDLVLPNKIEFLELNGLTNAKDLVLPNEIETLKLNGLTSAKDLLLPNNISDLSLNGLTNADELKLPKRMNYLDLDGLKSAENLILPDEIKNRLNMRGLMTAKGLVLPNRIGSLSLKSLPSAENLVLPEIIDGNLYLDGLTSIKDLELPILVEGTIYMRSLPKEEVMKIPNIDNYTVETSGSHTISSGFSRRLFG